MSKQEKRGATAPPRSPKRRSYDAEFKREALKLVDSGLSAAEVAAALGIRSQALYSWRLERKGREQASGEELSGEVEALRRRLREAEQERDILKKRWAFSAGAGNGRVPSD